MFPRTTVVAVAAFLDAFQKVADLATNSRGKEETSPSVCVCVEVSYWEHSSFVFSESSLSFLPSEMETVGDESQ